jgi:pimeloyl-ACP methyl ester carboxylesterase
VVAGRLVLVDPAGLTRLRVPVRTARAALGWVVRPDDARAGALVAAMAAPGFAPHPDLVQWFALVGMHARTTLAPARLAPRTLRRVRVPVSVLVGEHDPFLPAARLRRGARWLPDARVEVVAGTGHLLPVEAPDAVAGAVVAPGDPTA